MSVSPNGPYTLSSGFRYHCFKCEPFGLEAVLKRRKHFQELGTGWPSNVCEGVTILNKDKKGASFQKWFCK